MSKTNKNQNRDIFFFNQFSLCNFVKKLYIFLEENVNDPIPMEQDQKNQKTLKKDPAGI